jgi:hypothetical protein
MSSFRQMNTTLSSVYLRDILKHNFDSVYLIDIGAI